MATSCCLTSDAPLRHDSIMMAIAAPTRTGNQPPSTNFIELETRNVASIAPNAAMIGMAAAGGQAQRVTATR